MRQVPKVDARHDPKVEIRQQVRQERGIETQVLGKVVTMPQAQIVNSIAEVLQVQIHEVGRHEPKVEIREQVR